MATIVLSAVGLMAGTALNGTLLGLSTGVLGRAIGATIGRVIDQRIMGQGSEAIETGKVDRFRLTGASEGAAIGHVYGRMRVAGQVIWATRFQEHVAVSGGGKGAPPSPKTKEYSYSISIAVALCEGEISGVNRIWADGQLVESGNVTMRVYTGSQDQMPDPKIEAVEGAGTVPAYRGLAYVVLEDLDLARFGNRIPQFNFEVVRPAPFGMEGHVPEIAQAVKAVALMPGTGEYALASTPVHYRKGLGENTSANQNSASGKTDLLTSLDGLAVELPNCAATSLIVSWFGDDLRCGSCQLQPKVEQVANDGEGMPWSVSGVARSNAVEIVKQEGRSVYGGTPTDRSVIEGIAALKDAGQAVTFYPFILMDQLDGNGLVDPYSGAADQPVLPWRGRITTSIAPGQAGSPDQTAGADAEVAAFFGVAAVGDFSDGADGVSYSGPAEWSYRRFILHYAHLCAKAGGVEAFCIGSEMRGLTSIRGADGGFPAVEAMRVLAADVRTVLGAECKIGYAADWSEYFGYHPQDGTGDVYFHLDPLWADPEIDFIGIDNYMPLSDWRDGEDHADAAWGSIYNLDYLRANIEGGEGYDWYYASSAHDLAQRRSPISDGLRGEDWVFRYKDLRGWWEAAHHNRIAADPDSLVDGAPATWAVLGASVSAGTGDPYLGYGTPQAIASQGATGDAVALSTLDCAEDVLHQVKVYFAQGSSDVIRVRVDVVLGAIEVLYRFSTDAVEVVAGVHVVAEAQVQDLGNGLRELRFQFAVAADDDTTVIEIGPGSAVVGEDVVVYGAAVFEPRVTQTAWVPRSKPFWFTELGCAAIDKGTNQPNKFLDPKSSESQLPKYSNGRRDDFLQAQYLRAMLSYWDEVENNPISEVYGGSMIDMDRAHVWAWDARPYPNFPGNSELWSDGENYLRGHWLNGRASSRTVAGVVAEICERAGLSNYDVSGLTGVVRGYSADQADTARGRLQPLMLAYGFDAVEREGQLVFQTRAGRATVTLEQDRLAVSNEADSDLALVRAPEAEVAGRLRLSFIEADGEFATRGEEAIFPDEVSRSVSQSEMPLVLTRAEAKGIVERWLAESRVARDTAQFALPPSMMAVQAGDVVTLPVDDGVADYRIDRVEQGAFQAIEAVRVEPEIYEPSDAVELTVTPRAFVAPVPVDPVFLDLPSLTGDEVAHAPFIAVTARPWPGSVAVYASAVDDGYALNKLLPAPATMGLSETAMFAARSGVLDRGGALRVKLVSGTLSSASLSDVLNGANVAAIGDGSSGNWEVFQFTEAVLVGERTYDLRGRLRGQAGTDGIMPDVWPVGSAFVLLNGAMAQIDLALSARGLARHYRVGPAQRSYDDPTYTHLIEAFDGIGMRPYAPVHLRAEKDNSGDYGVSWVRRTRIDGAVGRGAFGRRERGVFAARVEGWGLGARGEYICAQLCLQCCPQVCRRGKRKF